MVRYLNRKSVRIGLSLKYTLKVNTLGFRRATGYIVDLNYSCSSCSCICCYLEGHRASCLGLRQIIINGFLTNYKIHLISDGAVMQCSCFRTSLSRTTLKFLWSLIPVVTLSGCISSELTLHTALLSHPSPPFQHT